MTYTWCYMIIYNLKYVRVLIIRTIRTAVAHSLYLHFGWQNKYQKDYRITKWYDSVRGLTMYWLL